MSTTNRLPDPRERPWLKVAELVEITGEGEKAIRAAIDAGHIPHIKVGRYIRIPTAEFRRRVGLDPEAQGNDDDAVTSSGPLAQVQPLARSQEVNDRGHEAPRAG